MKKVTLLTVLMTMILLFATCSADNSDTQEESLLPKLTAPNASMVFKTEPSIEKIQYQSLLEAGFISDFYIRNEIGSGTIITLSSNDDAVIYYTLDGSEPNTKSRIYNQPIEITKRCILKAKAVKKDYRDSDLLSLNIEKPYKRELILPSRFSFNDFFTHGNDISGLFIIYEATEDLSGPDFSRQHFMLKIDDGNIVSGDGIGSDLILTFDTFDVSNYDEALKIDTTTDYSTMNSIKCNGTFNGNLWIKEIYKCDDPEILGAPEGSGSTRPHMIAR